jgi:hypothetical protein
MTVQIIYGQVETRFFSQKNAFDEVEKLKNNPKAQKTQKLPVFNIEKLLEEDKMMEGKDIPFRFGKGFDVNISLSDGSWTEVEDGRLWSIEFESKGAFSINFVFNDFYLPEGANLYIGNTEGTMLYGPVTSKENSKDGYFLTDIIAGDKVTIYLFEPKDVLNLSKLTIKKAVHGYKNLFYSETYGNFGGSWLCHNDVVCFPEWSIESDAIALILLSNGEELCSGSLLMSADYSFRPYFLTAFHCIDTFENEVLSDAEVSDAQRWLFKFQYKKSSCSSNSPTTGITYNSGTLRAAWNSTDFALMEMNTSLIGDSRFTWLGWDRSGNNPTSGTGIHHPMGDVMKISFDNHTITPNGQIINWPNNIISPINSHWTVGYDDGTTQAGSSGSPLFNENKRVVGQLHGGNPGCAPITKFYGRFNVSWTGGGTNTTRLSNWLDLANTGVISMNSSRCPTISGPSYVCPGSTATFTVNNPPANYTWENSPNLTPVSGSPGTFTTSFIGGIATVKIIVNGTEIAKKDFTIGSQITGVEQIVYVGKNRYYESPSCSLGWNNMWILTWSNMVIPTDKPDTVYGKTYVDVVSTSSPSNMATYTLRLIQDGGNEIVKYISANNVKLVLSGITLPNPFVPIELLIYPNPATDIITVELSVNEPEKNSETLNLNTDKKTIEPYTIYLWSELHGLTRTIECTASIQQISLQELPAGMYYILITRDGEILARKIVRKN